AASPSSPIPWRRARQLPAANLRGSAVMAALSVAFQGERGSFSEEAAYKLLGRKIRVQPCETFSAIFESAAGGKTKYCLAPIENTLAGYVYENYDLLLASYLHIAGEVNLRM